MTLRELINSVDSELYSDNALYLKLRETIQKAKIIR